MSVMVILLLFSMLFVFWFDGTRYTIPNWLVCLLLISYPIAIVMSHHAVNWPQALAGALIVLITGYIIFVKKLMGGGDIKLLSVCALWVGLENLADFLVAVSLTGGAFAVAVWCIRKGLQYLPKKPANLPRILRDREPVPYGVAIAIGFLWMMWEGKVPVIL